ncbi:MAG TPA: type ISP restriction/modification enzyme [Planctomycetota bacterium]|nr:type ISP restriction/modification enzyme [Planctomycetota bacterium]
MTRATIFKHYAQALGAVAGTGDAREESFYGALRDLLKQVADATSRPHVHVTVQPTPTDAGNPDFRLWNGADSIIGYVEAKRPAETNLYGVEASEQLRRYRDTFPNLLLTNFTEFRLYRNGHHVETVQAASPNILNDLHAAPTIERPTELWSLLDQFLDFQLPQAPTAEELATQLAKRTRFLRQVLAQQIVQDDQAGGGRLSGFYEAFREFLIADLTHEQFADLYAQTVTYGLFAARTRSAGAFTRRSAFDRIPHTIGVLRDVFRFISLEDPPPQIEWIVDDIAEVLARADASGILDRYYHEHKGSDPIVHFYETFLAQYDPEERQRRGVYYTPEPVVSYIVRSLHSLLKSEFGMFDGLADSSVTLLDPAAGTMTFLAHAAKLATDEVVLKFGEAIRRVFLEEHVLERFYAFELMMAPYAVGHLKMGFFLEELGYRLADNQRVKFYLTNALDMTELDQSRLPGLSSLSQEAHLAGEVKKLEPILVILGNPPYSYDSPNRGDWILAQIEEYKQVDGKRLDEHNPRGLQDDYVKFLRFAQWKIEQAGRGIVGMITNHSYLDNPTFRGMRQSLMSTFDDMYVLDLHGSTLKRERCPDGSADQNVFEIQPGVAIAFFVKRGRRNAQDKQVRHAELWGTQKSKYEWLKENAVGTTSWQRLEPRSPLYLFVPRDEAASAVYETFAGVTDVFPSYCTGLYTGRDNLAVHWSRDELWRTVSLFSRADPELARQGYRLGKDSRDWQVRLAQKDLLASGPSQDHIVELLYRPFDVRYTYYTGRSRGFLCMPRPEVMRHMLQDNLALITSRMTKGEDFRHAHVSSTLVEKICMSPRTSNNGFVFPLYVSPETDRNDLFAQHMPSERQPNLHPKVMLALAAAHGRQPTPEGILHYIYAVLHAPAYRTKYTQFLRLDFPRIPFTKDGELFGSFAKLGERLTELHLLRSPELEPASAQFGGQGDGKVAKGKKAGLRYDPDDQRVYINGNEHFAPVPQAVWEYRVGGYQVCEKWLKDRRDRHLSMEEIKTYCRIVTALGLTIQIQQALDKLYPAIEGSLLPIELGS